MVRDAVRAGVGAARLPVSLVSHDLAAGKPVVTQDTGFGKFVPTGQGLLAYSTMEEAVDALARVNRDYAAHGAAARRVAAAHFGAGPVLGRLLADAGLG